MRKIDSTIPLAELGAAAQKARERSALEIAVERAAAHLRSLQAEDGHWCGELEGNSILESEYLLMLRFLGRWDDARVAKACALIRRLQNDDGGWSIHPGGPADVSTSVKAYFVLKLAGDRADAPHLERARARILALGGIDAANSFTKIELAIFGQFPWERCPAIPPEMILLPDRFPFNIYSMSSWSRVMVVPLSIIWAHRPVHLIPPKLGIAELRAPAGATGPTGPIGPIGPTGRERSLEGRLWRGFFRLVDRALWKMERWPHSWMRRRALERAERWVLDRMERCDGIGAIFPPIVNSVYALRCLGYSVDHPHLARQLAELRRLEIEDGETLRVQPCAGATWDTALALGALLDVDGGLGSATAVRRAARWLVDREVREPGDWQRKTDGAQPGGWSFQAQNELNPDCDDTAEVLAAIARVEGLDSLESWRTKAAAARGSSWLLAMQSDDGGWAAFDRNCDQRALTYVPFADHNAMIDPSTEDVTGRALVALNRMGVPRSHPAVRSAVRFLERAQQPDGTWYGRWGCNYLYGTYLALSGLRAAGEDLRRPRYRRSLDWIRAHQNADGGWGESFASYADPATKGIGESTAAQTAWALLGLFAGGDHVSDSVHRGVEYLLERQDPDGRWRDRPWTGTGFPEVFYLRYDLYPLYFPLKALAVHLRGGASR